MRIYKIKTYGRNFLLGIVVVGILCFTCYGVYELATSLSAEASNARGVEAFEEGDLPLAAACFERAVRANSKYSTAWLNLGYVAEENREFALAIKAYERVLETSKDAESVKTAHFKMAGILGDETIENSAMHPDRYKKAVAHLESLVAAEPGNAHYRLLLGYAAFRAINPGRGLQELEKASELASSANDLWIHKELMSFYARINVLSGVDKERRIITGIEAEISKSI